MENDVHHHSLAAWRAWRLAADRVSQFGMWGSTRKEGKQAGKSNSRGEEKQNKPDLPGRAKRLGKG